jgi:hypothetical protein
VDETYEPHFPYPPGDYTFDAGLNTNKTVRITVFGVEVETPDGVKVSNRPLKNWHV